MNKIFLATQVQAEWGPLEFHDKVIGHRNLHSLVGI